MANEWFCRCLNVNISGAKSSRSVEKPAAVDPHYKWINVDDNGVSITHPHLTIRTHLYRPSEGSSHPTRVTLLTCLICRLPMYRVTSLAESAEEMKDGPVLDLPSDRNNPLRTQDGWIEVSTSKDLLNAKEAERLKASMKWSPYFNLVLPDPLPNSIQSTAPTLPPLSIPKFPEHSPMLLPPPYTPSDSTFAHLGARAQAVSDEARQRAQEDINDFSRHKFEEFKELDARLRREIDLIWSYWRSGWLEHTHLVSHRGGDKAQSTMGAHRAPESVHRIKEFGEVPTPLDTGSYPNAGGSSATNVPKSSSLSNNLRSQMSASLPQPSTVLAVQHPPTNSRLDADQVATSSLPRATNGHLKRLLPQDVADESRAIAASYQLRMSDYASGSDVAHFAYLGVSTTNRAELLEEVTAARPEVDEDVVVGRSARDSRHRPPLSKGESPQTPRSPIIAEKDSKSPRPGEKKKVKFEAEKGDGLITATLRPHPDDNIEVGMFDMEIDDTSELMGSGVYDQNFRAEVEDERRADKGEVSAYAQRLVQDRREKPQQDFPASFKARAGFIGSVPEDRHLAMLTSIAPSLRDQFSLRNGVDMKQVILEKLKAEGLQTVTANSSPGSKDDTDSLIDESAALPSPKWNHQTVSFAASLPVTINFIPQSGMTLQPKTSLSERQSVLVPTLPRQPTAPRSAPGTEDKRTGYRRFRSKSISSVARDRTYAERDAKRSQDPGDALTVPDEDEEEEDGADEIEEQGRRNAYKILNRQSDVPDEAMWRSVAG